MKSLYYLLFLAFFIMSCTQTNTSDVKAVKKSDQNQTEQGIVKDKPSDAVDFSLNKNGIELVPVKSPRFNQAKLTMNHPNNGKFSNAGSIPFDFSVDNYVLGNQTKDADTKRCANSAKGQHIHLILNNEPYSAHYSSKFERKLDVGHYVSLAFLSRSYHESVKHQNAFAVTEFTVGDAIPFKFNKKADHMFYSRPKGNYIGEANIERVMLDFYLLNTDLSAEGNIVKATIDGTTFYIKEWVPYMMNGLAQGEHKVTLELIDAKTGKRVPGPFNKVERNFGTFMDEPLVK